jgi:hypothetical protein
MNYINVVLKANVSVKVGSYILKRQFEMLKLNTVLKEIGHDKTFHLKSNQILIVTCAEYNNTYSEMLTYKPLTNKTNLRKYLRK